MRQFSRNGPTIPSEILRAHEAGELVLFCGAGISVYTGLPSFPDLVKDTFARCGQPLPYRREAQAPRDQAFYADQYDRALHLLECDLRNPEVMRRQAVDRLQQPPSGGLQFHEDLLHLMQIPNGGCRIVTTNFDDRFALAAENLGIDLATQAGPRLGRPAREDLRFLTYLHGHIDTHRDPNGKDLVLTSGDFGRAYMADGWAARFVVELFREFTVLFIGYSLNDPVLRYLVDALAADMQRTGRFRQPYVLANHSSGPRQRQRKIEEWQAKGIEPIPFSTGASTKPANFKPLYDTIRAWRAYHTEGLGSRVSLCQTIGRKKYLPGPSGDQEAKELAWALSKPDGSVAKAVADQASTALDISWLAPLSQHKLPEIEGHLDPRPITEQRKHDPQSKDEAAPLAGDFAACRPSLRMHPVTWHFGRCLAAHREKQELVDWVAERGGIVNDEWEPHLRRDLEAVEEPWRTFWRIVLAGMTRPSCSRLGMLAVRPERADLDDLDAQAQLVAASAPYLAVKVRNPIVYETPKRTEPPRRVSDIARFEPQLSGQNLVQRALSKGDRCSKLLATVSDKLTSNLAEMVEMADAGDVTAVTQHHYFAVPTLAGREPETSRSWPKLVYLAKLAFLKASEHDVRQAKMVQHRWQGLVGGPGGEIFERLALDAMVEAPELSSEEEVLSFLLSGNEPRLWRNHLWPEVARVLRLRAWSDSGAERLLHATEAGMPPASRLHYGIDDQRAELMQIRRFAKLDQSGVSIPTVRQSDVSQFRETLSEDLDERLVGPVRVDLVPPAEAGELLTQDPAEIANAILENSDWEAGQQLRDLGLNEPGKLVPTLEILLDRKQYNSHLWNMALDVCRNITDQNQRKKLFDDTMALFDNAPNSLVSIGADPFAHFLETNAKLAEGERRGAFLGFWDQAWTAAVNDKSQASIDPTDAVTSAINDAGGKLAEALLTVLWLGEPKVGKGLPEDIRQRLEKVAISEHTAGQNGRILLAAHLVNLHAVDRSWVRDKLVPYMDWTSAEAGAMWQGFLWPSTISYELFDDLKEPFLALPYHTNQVGDDFARSYAGLVALGLLETPDLFTKSDCEKLFSRLPPSYRAKILSEFETHLKSVGDQAPLLWRNSIKPIVRAYFPPPRRQEDECIDSVSEAVASMVVSTGEAFPNALETAINKGLLTPILRPDKLISDLEPKNHQEVPQRIARDHPYAVLRLLNQVISDRTEHWALYRLNVVLNEIREAAPQVAQTPDFQKLYELTQRG